MKKWIISLSVCLGLVIVFTSIGVLFGINLSKHNIKENGEVKIYNNSQEDVIATNYSGFKITPNTIVVFEKRFNKCNHKEIKEETANEEIVNMNEQELQQYYKEWNIKQFGTEKVVLFKDIDEYCDKHYILKEQDDSIAIFNMIDDENSKLLKKTNISVKYLPETDKINLKTGINIYGDEKLNKWIEDFE